MAERYGERTNGLQMIDLGGRVPVRTQVKHQGSVRTQKRSTYGSAAARRKFRNRRAWYIKRRNQLLCRVGLTVIGVVFAILLVGKGISLMKGSGVKADSGQMENEDMPTQNDIRTQQADTKPQITEPVVTEPVIVLDAGHGGIDPGTMAEGVNEKDINLDIVKKLKDILEQKGYQVVLTREGDTALSLQERVDVADDAKAAVFVSIHQNALEKDTQTSGIQTYCSSDANADSTKLMEAIHSRLLNATNATDRGSHSDSDFYVVLNNTMPACLVETGFLTATAEREKLVSEEYQEKIAQAVADGIAAFLEGR